MDVTKNLVGRTWRHFMHDSLYRNSIILLLSSVVNAGFGFVFWIICAHFYHQEQIGIATALISATGLVSGFGTLGFNNSVIRFLPKTQDKNKLLNSAFIVVTAASLVAGSIFLLLLPHISPSLLVIRNNPWYLISFLVVVTGISVNIVIDNVFTAYRSTQFTLIKNGLISLLKILLLMPFLKLAGFGIFAAYGLAFLIVTLSGLVMLMRRFGYRPKATIDRKILQSTAKFSFANYIVSYVNGFPALVLPVIVVNLLGAKLNAIYYIAYTIASLLFFIPLGVGNALFAEGSSVEESLNSIIKRAAFINTLLVVPGVLLEIVFAPFILGFFGHGYSEQGVAVLRVLALSALFLAVAYPSGSILNIKHKLSSLIMVNVLGASAVVGLVYFFTTHGHGLLGVAWGWLIGWAVYGAIYAFAAFRALATTPSTTA
jgi:O-antigen/teichoic acid export membrane protein